MVSKIKGYQEIQIPSPLTQTWLVYRENTLAMAGLWGMVFLVLVMMFWTEPSAFLTRYNRMPMRCCYHRHGVNRGRYNISLALMIWAGICSRVWYTVHDSLLAVPFLRH